MRLILISMGLNECWATNYDELTDKQLDAIVIEEII